MIGQRWEIKSFNLFIHHIQIIIIVISHRIAWCFGGGQGVWLGFAFVPAFEFVGFAVACFVSVWQGATLFEGESIAGHWCFFVLRETCWRCNGYAVSIYELFGDLFTGDFVVHGLFEVLCPIKAN